MSNLRRRIDRLSRQASASFERAENAEASTEIRSWLLASLRAVGGERPQPAPLSPAAARLFARESKDATREGAIDALRRVTGRPVSTEFGAPIGRDDG